MINKISIKGPVPKRKDSDTSSNFKSCDLQNTNSKIMAGEAMYFACNVTANDRFDKVLIELLHSSEEDADVVHGVSLPE